MVSTSRAIDAALDTAERVTLTGSMMPAASRSVSSPVAALSPSPHFCSLTLDTMTAPSWPALLAIQYSGAVKDSRTILTPSASSPVRPRSSSSFAMCARAEPPPGTMPSSTAALVEATASSMRCLRSLSSVSVAAPTLMTATPPPSLARRSWSFSRSQSESVVSISLRICAMRA